MRFISGISLSRTCEWMEFLIRVLYMQDFTTVELNNPLSAYTQWTIVAIVVRHPNPMKTEMRCPQHDPPQHSIKSNCRTVPKLLFSKVDDVHTLAVDPLTFFFLVSFICTFSSRGFELYTLLQIWTRRNRR